MSGIRQKLIAWVLVAPLAAGVLAWPAPVRADDGLSEELLSLINEARARRDLTPLRPSPEVSRVAEGHTWRMVRENRLFHVSDLRGLLRAYTWRLAGQFVGCAKTVRRLFDRLMASPEHRHLLLEPAFRHAGLGVVGTTRGSTCGSGYRVWATGALWG